MFKLLKLEVKNHDVLESNVFSFVDESENKAQKYISLILGSNGTGKTRLFQTIIEIFIFIEDNFVKKTKKNILNYQFELTTFNGIDKIIFDNFEDVLKINSKSTTSEYKGSGLPNNLTVSSFTFNEKFPFIKDSKFYKYAGIRTTSNSIFTNKPIEETFNSLVKIINSKDKLPYLNNVFKDLKLKKQIIGKYKTSRNSRLLNNDDIKNLIFSFQKKEIKKDEALLFFDKILRELIEDRSKGRRRFQQDAIKRFLSNPKASEEIFIYLVKYAKLDHEKSKSLFFDIEINYSWEDDSVHNNNMFIDHVTPFKHMSDLEIITFNTFQVNRRSFYDFNGASSGEIHLLQIISGILSNIENNSLILIDEPEISLHPKWQNSLTFNLLPIQEAYPNSHFIIASHSHFLVSDLNVKRSSITSLKRSKSDLKLIVENLNKINTLGWSAEQILFEVFEMSTDRNYYISLLVEEIITEISSNNPNRKIIETNQKKLNKLDLNSLNPDDPFNKILNQVMAI